MSKTDWVQIDAELEYAKVFEDDRDMGNEKVNLDKFQGVYRVTCIMDDENKQKLLKAGVPQDHDLLEQKVREFMEAEGIDDPDLAAFKYGKTKEGEKLTTKVGYQQKFKKRDDGRWSFSFKRPHFNPNLAGSVNSKTGEVNDGYMGAPRVTDYAATQEAKEFVMWDPEVKLGNGTKAKVKVQIYKGGNSSIITLEAVSVVEHVEYIPAEYDLV